MTAPNNNRFLSFFISLSGFLLLWNCFVLFPTLPHSTLPHKQPFHLFFFFFFFFLFLLHFFVVMSGNYSFVIVGKDDNPLYELDLGSFVKKDCPPHLSHFILHSALDIVEELVWKNTALYLKVWGEERKRERENRIKSKTKKERKGKERKGKERKGRKEKKRKEKKRKEKKRKEKKRKEKKRK